MDDTFAQLEAQYCPPLDPPLVSAILSDYDLSDTSSLENAKKILDELKADALLDEAGAFDPSGTGASENDTLAGISAQSQSDTSAPVSHSTDTTSLSNGLSSLDLSDEHAGADANIRLYEHTENFDILDDHAKTERLDGIFGDQISRYSIQYTLRKCNGNWDATVEDLLRQAYFLEAENIVDGVVVSSKSIDAFSDDNTVRRGRKGKAKKRKTKNVMERRSSSVPGLGEQNHLAASNKWQSATEDVEFIANRTGIASAAISSVYYEKGASIQQTIAALLKASIEESKHLNIDGATMSSQARDLERDFPTVSLEYLNALIRLTSPSTTAAHELARALTHKPREHNGGGIQIIPQYTPAEDLLADPSWSAVTKKARSAATSRSSSSDMASAIGRKDTYALARAAAFSQASAAHRKAKSDRLMGGAAAYYGQVGREYAALSSNASAQAADQLVASQSTANQLDLHGVDVLNAVRIAQEKVEEWWDGLGESRVNGRVGAEDRQTGYRIVVGLGRHSEGGKGKLGPAVTKMLKQESWRVEPAGAVIVVKGPLTKR